jgi:hypothetical protein
MVKNNTGRKETVVKDDLNIKGGGVYCFMPFSSLDKNNKAVFKIGMSMNFSSRTEAYHTYFPLGVYMVAFLENPKMIQTRSKSTITRKQLFLKAEKWIMNYIEDNGGKRIKSTTRVQNANVDNEGDTEWFYTNEDLIHEAFTEAEKKFNGEKHLFYLEGLDPITNRFTSINDIAKKDENKKPNYTGKIIYLVK